jgi:hypothetical protein
MATPLAEAFVEVRADTRQVGPDIQKGTTDAVNRSGATMDKHGRTLGAKLGGGMGASLKSLGPSLLAGLAGGALVGGVVALTGAVGGFVNGARDAERITRLNEQVIKTTGGAAHVTAAQVDDLSTALSNKTGIDDDNIKSSANLLLTFTNVRNEVGKNNDIFNRATAASQDMAASLGVDGKAAALQLGKALNDPIKGITALSRSGVSFTEQQKKQIKTLVAHGNTLGAQKIILKELGKEFGGAAAASSDPMQKLGTILTNTAEGLAGKLLPWLDKAATWIASTGLPMFDKFVGFLQANVLPVLGRLASWIAGTVVPALQRLASGFMENVWPALQMVAAMIAENLQPVIASMADYWTNTLLPAFQDLMPILQKVGTWIGVVVGVIAVLVSWIVGKLAPVLINIVGGAVRLFIAALGKVVGAVQWVIDIVPKVYTKVKEVFGNVVEFVKGLPEKFKNGLSTLASILTAPFRFAFNGIAGLWNSTVGKLSFTAPEWIPGIGGKGWDVPDIPTLGDGGFVPATRGGRIVKISEAGEGEYVGTAAQMQRWFGGRSIMVSVDARGAAPGEGAAFERAARRVAEQVVDAMLREVAL